MVAADVIEAIRARHPSNGMNGGPGEWTVICEWKGIDVLAWSAWHSSDHKRVGYEVKVSRSDYRREVLRPDKRAEALALCNEFYLAVPKGLLHPEEIEWEEPIWDDGAWSRVKCPVGCVKAKRYARENRYTPRQGTVLVEKVPVPVVFDVPFHRSTADEWIQQAAERLGQTAEEYLAVEIERYLPSTIEHHGWVHIACPVCGGKGYVKGSRVEVEAPTLWVPADVGLVEVDGRGCRIAKKAPATEARDLTRSELGDLVRWCSFRGDARHRPTVAERVVV